MTTRASRRIVRALLGRITVGTLVIVEDGRTTRLGAGEPCATVNVRSDRVWPLLMRGSRGLAEAYELGFWDAPDLVGVIRLAALNAGSLDRARAWLEPLAALRRTVEGMVVRSTRETRRMDIAAHYDLGNRLFAQMLDPTMSYSCAVFERPDMTLEEAQLAKLERICEKLALTPGERVVEIGSGWGALAIHAARTRGVHVTTTTLSREQYDHATERVRAEGLGERVTVLLQDYLDLTGRYDKLVSIEMIEAVGWRHFGTYFEKCSDLLVDDGAMLLQAIVIDDRAYRVERAAPSFINTRIFPGGRPAVARGHRDECRATHRPADRRAGGHHVSLRDDARVLAAELHGQLAGAVEARLRRALPAHLDALSRLLRGRLRGATDL